MPNDVPAFPGGRQFRPRLWPTLAAALVAVVTILLGNWQARRAELRADLQAQNAGAQQQPPLVLRSAGQVGPAMRYRRAVAEGEYVADQQVWLDNRTYRGTAGYYVLTPLRLDDGAHLLVNRGWIAGTPRHEAPAAPPPAGRVQVTGRLNQAPPSFIELQHNPPSGRVWQNFDLAAFARVAGLAVAPLVLEQQADAVDGLVRAWPAPDSGRDKNVSYMWQWYSFAGLTVVLWFALNWQRSDAGRQRPRGRNAAIDGADDGVPGSHRD
ncbi:MAG: SURF1 family protein [Betaproteobacteria bacterium]